VHRAWVLLDLLGCEDLAWRMEVKGAAILDRWWRASLCLKLDGLLFLTERKLMQAMMRAQP